jgi:hypothetical protein
MGMHKLIVAILLKERLDKVILHSGMKIFPSRIQK